MEDYETKSKSGKIEERHFEDSGKFVIYSYIDKETGRKTKEKLILIGSDSRAYFIIPASKKLLIDAKFDLNAYLKNGDKIESIADILSRL
ncbi:hypothetical protein [Picrophilus oshimae]|uniref:Uncharacterized protein n=1 Tax=Picrophilus torridus (strain ATCC 700027 / DSM 9790 / JCM 10055 / NBRC 100828 / KAW 2/3) TaxID=1122961 RepID=Q6KZT5_PICTO|nr:hypothetical protein [Picrophilus oshimae]AAT43767.1 hypothetical protein PTO1182 [Picrophilus oshimae DSM 9789]SMD31167.1 hypothetical protein SAMN02745355_1088 [Picrophilus oshimae DSM 9789]